MPLYEYECPKGHKIEVIESFDTKDRHLCAVCENPKHPQMKRLISAPQPAIVQGGTNASYKVRK